MVSRLRAERILRELSLHDVREKTGIGISRLSLLEREIERPRRDEAEELSAVFNVPIHELFATRVKQ